MRQILLKIHNDQRIAATILIASAVVLGILCTSYVPRFAVISDYADYDTIGMTLVSGHYYPAISNDHIIYPPLYPIFLASLYSLFGHSYTAVFIAQFFLLGISAFLVFRISRDFLQLASPYPLLAGISILIWPYFILYSLLITGEILFITLLLSSAYFLLAALSSENYRKTAAAGIFFALATLARPVSLLLPIWLAIGISAYVCMRHKSETLHILKNAAIGLIVFFATLLPWTIYASVTFNSFIPISSNFQSVFDKGNKTFEYLESDQSQPKKTPTETTATLVKAKLMNVYLFWDPGAGGYQAETIIEKFPVAANAITAYKTAYFAMLILAAFAFLKHKSRKTALVIGFIVIYFWGVHTALFPSPRYTLPVIPFTLLLAWAGVEYFVFHISSGKINRLNA